MNLNLKDKVVIVTGADGNLGKAICKCFAENDAIVAAVGTCEDTLTALTGELGGKAAAFCADVSDNESAKAMVQAVVDKFGRVDCLINNACIFCPEDKRVTLEDFDDALWTQTIGTGLNAVFFCSKPASAQMVLQGEGGSIVNVASAAGLTPIKNQCAFVAANAGVYNFTKAMALELGPHKIRVNAVAPGAVEGDPYIDGMVSHDAEKRAATAEEIAQSICFVASPLSSFTTGSIIPVDGGFSAGFARDF